MRQGSQAQGGIELLYSSLAGIQQALLFQCCSDGRAHTIAHPAHLAQLVPSVVPQAHGYVLSIPRQMLTGSWQFSGNDEKPAGGLLRSLGSSPSTGEIPEVSVLVVVVAASDAIHPAGCQDSSRSLACTAPKLAETLKDSRRSQATFRPSRDNRFYWIQCHLFACGIPLQVTR